MFLDFGDGSLLKSEHLLRTTLFRKWVIRTRLQMIVMSVAIMRTKRVIVTLMMILTLISIYIVQLTVMRFGDLCQDIFTREWSWCFYPGKWKEINRGFSVGNLGCGFMQMKIQCIGIRSEFRPGDLDRLNYWR